MKQRRNLYSQTGRELLFDLDRDPQEQHDQVGDGESEEHLAPWRRLIEWLRRRPEGFTDGERLIAGRPHRNLVSAG